MSSTKRKFKYKLTGFEQLWGELERLEEREVILVEHLGLMFKAAHGDLEETPDAIYQQALDQIQAIPGKSAGYKMIENMGIEFYEKAKDQFGE